MSASHKVSVTEFQERPASALRRARKGVVVEITASGRTVASLVPGEAPTRPSMLDEVAHWRRRHPNLTDDPFGDDA